MNGTQAKKLLHSWKAEPSQMYRDVWGEQVIMWDKLEEIAKSVADNRRTVVPSGHGLGKTFLAARLALWFLICFYPSKVITTAPTWHQVKSLLWSELHTAYNNSNYPIGGKLNTVKLEFSKEWFAIGLSTKQDGMDKDFGAQRFQGFHSKNLLIIIDEAAGVSPDVLTACESLVVAKNNRILMIGNPASPTGHFYNACRSPLWNKIKLSCFDHPNVKTGQELIPGAVTREWIEDARVRWGEGSPLWIAKVLGEFPPEGVDTLIPLTYAERAIDLEVKSNGSRRLACDVARFGGDETVIAEMIGEKVIRIDAYNKRDLMWTAGEIMSRIKQNEYDYVIVDDTGLGGGVTDRLDEQGIDVTAVNFGGKAIDQETFVNRKAEIFWLLGEAFKNKNISIPNDLRLINQLTSIKFKYDSRGRIKIESKEDMKKRGLDSPDRADAVAMCYAYCSRLRGDESVGFVIET